MYSSISKNVETQARIAFSSIQKIKKSEIKYKCYLFPYPLSILSNTGNVYCNFNLPQPGDEPLTFESKSLRLNIFKRVRFQRIQPFPIKVTKYKILKIVPKVWQYAILLTFLSTARKQMTV